MGSYAILDNRNNAVLEVVDWDGISAGPPRAIDTTMHELPEGVTPEVGQIWNGTVFMPAPVPPVAADAEEEPEPPAEDPFVGTQPIPRSLE